MWMSQRLPLLSIICVHHAFQQFVDIPAPGLPRIGGSTPTGASIVIVPIPGRPYKADESLIVSQGSELYIEAGTRILFEPSAGLIIYGKVIINGSEHEPVVLSGFRKAEWRGVSFDSELDSNPSMISSCIIEDASYALMVNSRNVYFHNCTINTARQVGLTITSKAADVIDLDQMQISYSQQIGVLIRSRNTPLVIRGFHVFIAAGSCVEVSQPSTDITIMDFSTTNCGQLAVDIGQINSPMVTVVVADCIISEQHRLPGLAILALDYRALLIDNCLFENNTASSMLLSLHCLQIEDPNTSRVKIRHNAFRNNSRSITAQVSLFNCVNAEISDNLFSANNYVDRNYGALKVTTELVKDGIEPNGGETFTVDIKDNRFVENYGEYCVYLLHMSMYHFRGLLHGNTFVMNSNGRSVMIVGSPEYAVQNNVFDNPDSVYNLEVEYNDGRTLLATDNYWGLTQSDQIQQRIFDNRVIQTRGTVQFEPFAKTPPEFISLYNCSALNECSLQGICTAAGTCVCNSGRTGTDCARFDCSAVSDCSGNGECTAANTCDCVQGWLGPSCSEPSCLALDNCSSRGICVSINECNCDVGYTGEKCEISRCAVACTEHGRCNPDLNRCVCAPGWFGEYCGSENPPTTDAPTTEQPSTTTPTTTTITISRTLATTKTTTKAQPVTITTPEKDAVSTTGSIGVPISTAPGALPISVIIDPNRADFELLLKRACIQAGIDKVYEIACEIGKLHAKTKRISGQ